MSLPITRRNLLQIAPLASLAASATIFQPGRARAQTNQPSQVLSAGSFLPTSFQYGVGFNWYDVFGNDDRGNPTYPALDDAAGWRAVHEALDDLRPAIIRFGIPADDCVGQGTSQIRTDSVHFERLRRVADWAERSGCTILLDPFDIAKKFQFAPGPHDKGKWLEMAPRDNDGYAREFVAPLLQHVATKMNLRAVKLFNACNEPLQYGPFTTPENHPDAFVDYVDMYRAIQQALKENGVYPGKIRLAGVDCIQPSRFPELDFIARGVDIDPYIDVYTIHYYFHRFDWMAPVPFLENSLEQSLDRETPKLVSYCARRGKPLLASEVGWYPNDGDPMPSDPLGQSRHIAALITAETMVRGMNAGLSGFAVWTLLNPGNFDGAWQVAWVRGGKLFKSEHLYPMYRLFTRFARPGSKILPLSPETREWPWQYVHGTALVTSDDRAAAYVINDNLVESRQVTLNLPKEWAGRKFRKVIKDSVRLGLAAGVFTPKPRDRHSVIEDLLTPMSLNAYLQEEG